MQHVVATKDVAVASLAWEFLATNEPQVIDEWLRIGGKAYFMSTVQNLGHGLTNDARNAYARWLTFRRENDLIGPISSLNVAGFLRSLLADDLLRRPHSKGTSGNAVRKALSNASIFFKIPIQSALFSDPLVVLAAPPNVSTSATGSLLPKQANYSLAAQLTVEQAMMNDSLPEATRIMCAAISFIGRSGLRVKDILLLSVKHRGGEGDQASDPCKRLPSPFVEVF
jgi:hypothetical protein